MFFIREDKKKLSGQRELTKSSIRSIRTGKGSNEISTSLTVSSIGCFYSLSLLNMRNAMVELSTQHEKGSGSLSARRQGPSAPSGRTGPQLGVCKDRGLL